jgi:hypothetical protein
MTAKRSYWSRPVRAFVNTGSTKMNLVGIFSATPVRIFEPAGAALELPWSS